MLPDFPKLKSDMWDLLQQFMRERIQSYQGPFSELRTFSIHEGVGTKIISADGSIETNRPRETCVETSIAWDELPRTPLALAKVVSALDEAAKKMGQHVVREIYASVSKAAEKAGNVADAKGAKLNANLFLEVTAQRKMDFKPDGTPEGSSLHVHPNQSENVKRMIEELENSPELKRRYDEIIDRKREEWRAREASRSLVG